MTIYYGRTNNGRICATNVLERLWRNSTGDSDDECWEITHKDQSRAGHVRIRLDDKSRMMVHRLAYEAHHASPIPKGMQINHHCDNPRCFNPLHLYLGTHADNMRDKSLRNRHNPPKKLTDHQINYVLNSSKSNKELGKELGVASSAIYYHRKKHALLGGKG